MLCVLRILQAKIKLTNKTILRSYTFTQMQKIVTYGKTIRRPADKDGSFYSFFYNNQEYFDEIIYKQNIKSYSCIGVINPY